jgi:hypothetical protein
MVSFVRLVPHANVQNLSNPISIDLRALLISTLPLISYSLDTAENCPQFMGVHFALFDVHGLGCGQCATLRRTRECV